MDKCKIKYGCTFLMNDIKRMMKKMNYASLRIVWRLLKSLLQEKKRLTIGNKIRYNYI